MLDSINGFHLEPTNMCTLKCPKCARTDLIPRLKKSWSNQNLNIAHLQSFLDINLSNKKFTLCGNYGDPIYYDELFDLVEYIKKNGASVHIVTNGSYKKREWWDELSTMLTEDDIITFSIDGTPENFTQYRINADWDSIRVGIETMATGQVTTEWKFIPFSYNVNDIDIVRTLSDNMGIDKFTISPSSRWDVNDALKPDDSLVSAKFPSIVKWHDKKLIEIDPECKNTNSAHFISASGQYSPCCYSADHRFYYASQFYKNRNEFDISKTTISTVLASMETFFDSITETKLQMCTFSCPKK